MKKTALLGWIICLLSALFYAYDFLLRVMPSVMIHPLMHAFNASAADIGFLSAFYYYAYTPLQLPAGLIIDRYNTRWVLSLSALLCALGAILFALTANLMIANLARAMMGIGSAFAFVGALKLGSLWLPTNRFALFAGLTTTFGTLGAVFADSILSFSVSAFGWQFTALSSGFAGLIIAALLFFSIKDQALNPKSSAMTWKSTILKMIYFSKNSGVWINGIVGGLLFLPISVFASLWGSEFFAKAYHLSSAHAASAMSLIFIGMAIGSPFVGHLSDKLQSRRLPMLLGSIGVISSLACLLYLSNLPLFMGYLLLFLLGFCTSPQILVFAIAKDLSSASITGIATSVTNFIVTMGAALFQPLIGIVLDASWHGKKTKLGTPDFSLGTYQIALSCLLVALILSLFLIPFIPKKLQITPVSKHDKKK